MGAGSKPHRVSIATFRDDPLYPRIARAVAAILAGGKKVIDCNLAKLDRLLRILRMHAHELDLVPSTTAYVRWGKGPKERLRFSRTGEGPVEEAYSRHFIWPGKGPFHPARPRIDMSASVKNKYKKPADPIGLAWYRQDQWALLRELSVDRDKISETWAEWEATASEKLAELAQRGLDIRRVDVDVNELRAWCERQGRQIDAAARSEFVADQMRLRARARST